MTTTIAENPIDSAIKMLNKDGWVIGSFRCSTGERCAVGALRASLDIYETNRKYVWTRHLSLKELTERNLFKPVDMYDPDNDKNDLDSWARGLANDGIVAPITPEITAEYQKAIVLIADTLDPYWDQDMVDTRNAFSANSDLVTIEDVRTGSGWLESIEEVIYDWNDNRVDTQVGRDEVLSKFAEAAANWNAA